MEDCFFLIAVPGLSWFGGIVIIRSSNSASVKIITNVVFLTGAHGGPQRAPLICARGKSVG